MKKVKIIAMGALNAQGWANRAYTEIDFNASNKTTGANLNIKPTAGKSFAIIHLDEATAKTAKKGSELNVHPITDFTGFVSFEVNVGQGIKNTTTSKDASATDTLKRSIGIVTGAGVPDALLEIAFGKTYDALNASKVAGKTARKGLRGNGLQSIVPQDATATNILNPITES